MAVFSLYSKRQRIAREGMPDVFVYDDLPAALRVQIVHIITDAFGTDTYGGSSATESYKTVETILSREYGLFRLTSHPRSHRDSVVEFFINEKSVDRALDVVEVCFKLIHYHINENDSYKQYTKREIEPKDAIAELNERFKEHAVGFRFESGELIRIDSEILHAEAVKPALALLRDRRFSGANEEFLNAHEHYRHARYKECAVESLKSFESTMKTICELRKWRVTPNDTAKTLITTCLDNGLIPAYLESQLGAIRALLESGIPTVRNKNSGHGQGVMLTVMPEQMARYTLNMTATTILFIVESHFADA